ncbi:hypothetical protein D1007_47036 [Hordeum vulgare]|nr:hypothetical protein D1007_47036 [Hordeum vulgare]
MCVGGALPFASSADLVLHPLSLSFAELLVMDKSRGSSTEAVSGVKRRCDETLAAGADLEYEASLRSQLEAARADHEQMAHDHEDRIKPPSFVYGLGLLGCSFFALDGEPPRVATAPALSNVVVISVQGQKITPQVVLEGLRVWAVDGSDWQLHQVSDFEFSVVFPSSESVRMIASCTSFTLPLNQLVISAKAAANGFKSVGQFSEVWVLVEDVLAEYRSVCFLMAFGILLGTPIEVDGESLVRLGLVRMKIWCVDLVCLYGPVDVFASTDGIRLRVRLEGAEASQVPPPPPHPDPSSSKKRNDGSAGGGTNPSGGSGGDTNARFTQSEWDRLGHEVQNMLKQNGPNENI